MDNFTQPINYGNTTCPEANSKRDYFPPVLDVCCGTKMMWFDKKDKRTLFHDIRNCEYEMLPYKAYPKGTTIKVCPDVVGDLCNLAFPDNTFSLVVFDPPHIRNMGKGKRVNSVFAKQYGLLFDNWRSLLAMGFSECFRVLRPGGVLIFKWSEVEISLKEVLDLTEEKPLFGNRTGKKAKTHWVTFLKPIPQPVRTEAMQMVIK